ncbi:MAG: oligosaccharide flippase family protein [Aureispira sp.]|nr:oligosaccharide flippase family protein [Aureispira sp.]
MGVIQRQAAKASIVRYIGVVIGMVSTIFIYPFELELYGLFQFLIPTAAFLVPLGTLGFSASMLRYFPLFNNAEKEHHGMLGLLFLISIFGILVITGLLFLFSPFIYEQFQDKSPLLLDYMPVILVLFPIMVLSEILAKYALLYHRLTVPNITELFIKIVLPLAIIAYINDWITIKGAMFLLIGNFLVRLLVLSWYVHKVLGGFFIKIDWAFLKTQWKKKKPVEEKVGQINLHLRESIEHALYAILYLIGATISTRIDAFMVTSYLGLTFNGIYTIAFVLAAIITIPMHMLNNISAPIIADLSAKGNNKKIEELYKKGSINLFLIGLFILSLIWGNVGILFEIHPKGPEIEPGKYVILALGLGYIFDMLTSFSTIIISYSKLFRYNLIILLFTAIANIILNIIFIPKWGLLGAAIATSLSLFFIKLIRVIIVWRAFKIHPFSKETVFALILCLSIYFLSFYLIYFNSVYINFFVQSIIFTLLFGGLILKLELSEDINKMVRDTFAKFRK